MKFVRELTPLPFRGLPFCDDCGTLKAERALFARGKLKSEEDWAPASAPFRSLLPPPPPPTKSSTPVLLRSMLRLEREFVVVSGAAATPEPAAVRPSGVQSGELDDAEAAAADDD
jgi:hypothetical protein